MINGKHVTLESVEYSSFTAYRSLFFIISYSLFLFQISFTHQSFQEVIVSIVQRNVNFLTVRNTANRMHQDKVSICSNFCAISR